MKVEEKSKNLDYVIDIVKLSKSFKRQTLSKGSYTTIKSALLSIFKLKQRDPSGVSVTHAIKDLTLRIPRGASIGIIGRNGSGKSTLLKLLTGIYKPDYGSVNIRGRISALIELGAGFHPDFTGRENLFLAGVMHGLTKREIIARFDEIVSFAELEHVIDDPVRTYSSGMFMRLGFSIAIHTDPDILFIDEVLAVGDAAFVAKCKDRISELHKLGKTLVLVTHDLDAVERWCDEVIWLHEGEVKDRGYPRRVIDNYRHFLEKGEEVQLLKEEEKTVEAKVLNSEQSLQSEEQRQRWGSREIEIIDIDLLGEDGSEHRVFRPEDKISFKFKYKINEKIERVVFGIGINRADGLNIFGTNTDIERLELGELKEQGEILIEIPRIALLDGSYSLDVAAHGSDGYPYDYHKNYLTFNVRSELKDIGVFRPLHSWMHNGMKVEETQ